MTDPSARALHAGHRNPMPSDYRGGCAKGMPLQGACHSRCLHRAMVEDYRAWHTSWLERREDKFHMTLEDDDYAAMYPPPTFRAWLESR